ncbi:MAG: ATP-binding cassette domain-containing protein [Candidatus Poribacteria bacterium]|nr:ATP-binding cassette domain-containing protein [Candidatus Poribacteria bacterium]
MIEVSSLSKRYGSIQALDDIGFRIEAGEIVGLLGPNGAGKSTAIKIITGYIQPDEGTVTVDELDVLTHRIDVQALLGYLPENAPLYPELSVQSYLKLMANLRQIPAEQQPGYIGEAVRATGLVERLTQPIGQLSKGFRQRVGLAQAILHKPKLLILDEPTVGLDPTQIIEIRELIRRLSAHSTILFSTHILPEVEALCDRAIILMNGQVRADANLAELSESADALLILQEDTEGVVGALKGLEGVSEVRTVQSRDGRPSFRVVGKENADLCPAIYDLARQRNWKLRELRRDVRTLEMVFNELARGA